MFCNESGQCTTDNINRLCGSKSNAMLECVFGYAVYEYRRIYMWKHTAALVFYEAGSVMFMYLVVSHSTAVTSWKVL